MKLNQIQCAIAALLVTGVAGVHAQQQSNIEIYGQIGAGLNYKNHQTAADGTVTDVSTNALNVSHLGFRGREDLGGGLGALFRLEATVAPDTGVVGKAATGQFFDRQSYVGLYGQSWGSLTLGRQFHAITDRTIRTTDVYQVGGANAHNTPLALYGVDRYQSNDNRSSNTVKYRYDQPTGVQFGASYSMGEVAGSNAKGSSYSLDLAYEGSGFGVGGGIVSFNAPASIATTNVIPKNQLWSLGGNMQLGPAKVYLAYYNSSIDSLTAGQGAQKNRIAVAGVAWQVSPLVMAKASYTNDKGTTLNGVAGRDGTKNTLVLSAEYSLSKRTSMYANLATNNLSGGYLQETLYTAALGRNPTASSVQFYSVGINHKF